MATLYNAVESDNFTTAIGGSVPGAGDTVYINRFARQYTLGLSAATNKAALIEIQRESQCEFDTGLIVKADKFVNRGSQNRLVVRSSSSTGELSAFLNMPARPTSITQLGSCLAATGIINTSGTLNIQDDVDPGSGDVMVFGGDVTIAYSGSLLIDGFLHALGGLTRARRRAEEIRVGGSGVVLFDNPSAAQGDIEMNGGSLVIADSGTIDEFIGRTGVLDLTRLARPLTFTNWVEYPGLTIKMSRNTPPLTKTSSAAPLGNANVIYVD